MADEGRKRKMQRKKGANLMKNLFKKIGALLVAAVMVLSMCTAVFATETETGTQPLPGDKKKVIIQNVEAGATVKAYKLVKAKYNTFGFTGYEWTKLADRGTEAVFTDDGKLNISDEKVIAIAKKIDDNTSGETLTLDTTTGESNEELEVGSYLILVTGGSEKIYNPMLVSVYYKDGTEILTGKVDANDSWQLESDPTYAKSSGVKISKTVNKTSAAVKTEKVTYTITGTIPSYSTKYEKNTLKYVMTDTTTNLKIDTDTIKVFNGKDVAIANTNYTLDATGTGFTLNFTSDYIDTLRNKSELERGVKVTYTATLTEDASNFDAANNKVELDYTHNPGQTNDKKKAETNTYTFDINGQIVKIDANNAETKLGGAEFTLYEDKDLTKKVKTAVSSSEEANKGSVVFKGLKEGTYYLKETKAPSTYQLTENVYKIDIVATYASANNDQLKTLTSYTITVTNTNDSNDKRTFTYNSKEDTTMVVTNPLTIKNTKLGTLPSTGGMGTYLFTIIGVVVMAGAAGAFFISRRKGSEE
jgi:fimbrial isopeptide formation D2 family protein/LPXTG-motif cell wall-anchored protein